MKHQPPTDEGPTQYQLVALFETHVDDLYRFCLARTGSETSAEDATAEAFLAAARTFAAGRGDEVDRPWLFVVARRRMVDQWRAAERARRRIDRVRSSAPQSDPDPSEEWLVDPTSEHVLAALGSLPNRQRAALTLRYLDECSVSEVATELGIEYRAAESLLARGRRGFTNAWKSMAAERSES